MHYTLYRKYEDGCWHPIRHYSSKDALIYALSSHKDIVDYELAMNDNDTNVHYAGEVSEGQEYTRCFYLPRRLMVLDEDKHIVDPRPWLNRTSPNWWAWHDDIMEPERKIHWSSKRQGRHSHRGRWYRRVGHYKQCLKDDYFYRDEADGYNIRLPHTVENPWITEPSRDVSACWKTQTKFRHQYEKNVHIYKSSLNTIRYSVPDGEDGLTA